MIGADEQGICAVVVTYGERSFYLKQVIGVLLESALIRHVVIVDNAASIPTQKYFNEIKDNAKLEILHNNDNLGSAAGFKMGMERASRCLGTELVLLLDDDNVPLPGCLEALIRHYNSSAGPVGKCLAVRRLVRGDLSKQSFFKDMPEDNSCWDFHIKDSARFIGYKFSKSAANPPGGITVKTNCYGGLFFHKDILARVGYPDTAFYLYQDDTEFTYRISKKIGRISVCADALIKDVDIPLYRQRYYAKYPLLAPQEDSLRLYYTFRNRVFFERKYLVSNKAVYALNANLFFLVTIARSFIRLPKCGRIFKNLRIIMKAVSDGRGSRMGRLEEEGIDAHPAG